MESSDRAINYTTNTVNNVFYIITAAASILVLMGWSSLRDVNKKMREIVDTKVSNVTRDYEDRLSKLEQTLKKRSEELIETQEEIVKSNNVRGFWMRAGLETSTKEKINLYDEILKLDPENVEAISYKADAVLELGEDEWALNLADKAINLDNDYGYAYWQKACAEAETGMLPEAIEDIKIAIEKTPSLKTKLKFEQSFKSLEDSEEFKEIIDSLELRD